MASHIASSRFPGSAYTWPRPAPAHPSCAGWTDAPRDGYTREAMLADLVAMLDALQLDRIHVIAHDLGAIFGFELCLRYPQRVGKHITLSIPHPFITFSPS